MHKYVSGSQHVVQDIVTSSSKTATINGNAIVQAITTWADAYACTFSCWLLTYYLGKIEKKLHNMECIPWGLGEEGLKVWPACGSQCEVGPTSPVHGSYRWFRLPCGCCTLLRRSHWEMMLIREYHLWGQGWSCRRPMEPNRSPDRPRRRGDPI
jgi:hypothetical protein